MILQHLILPDPHICGDFRLYTDRVVRGTFPIELKTGESLEFRGFVNFFSLTKWKKYTDFGKLFVCVDIEGLAEVEIILTKHDSTEIISKARLSNTIMLDVPGKYCEGLLSVRILAVSDIVLKSGSFVSEKDPINYVRLGFNICTYHRHDYVKKKIKAFQCAMDFSGGFEKSAELFIVDNASELIDISDDSRIHVIYNENTGGSGGFSKGIVEIDRAGDFTHVVFMDDDTTVEPESLYRTWAFLSLIRIEYSDLVIGGAMLSNDQKNIVYEAGARYKKNLKGVIKCCPLKHGLDVATTIGCLDYDIEEQIDYCGWWYCAYPISFANANNLPWQVFMKYDDVEYGLRYGHGSIILNGIFSWHEDFEKKKNSLSVYYSVRNHLILNCMYFGERNKGYERKILRDSISSALCLSYDIAMAKMDAIRDSRNMKLDELSEMYNARPQSMPSVVEKSCYNAPPRSKFIRMITINGAHHHYSLHLQKKPKKSQEVYGVSILVVGNETFKRSLRKLFYMLLRFIRYYL